jgi:hypothetical protein
MRWIKCTALVEGLNEPRLIHEARILSDGTLLTNERPLWTNEIHQHTPAAPTAIMVNEPFQLSKKRLLTCNLYFNCVVGGRILNFSSYHTGQKSCCETRLTTMFFPKSLIQIQTKISLRSQRWGHCEYHDQSLDLTRSIYFQQSRFYPINDNRDVWTPEFIV